MPNGKLKSSTCFEMLVVSNLDGLFDAFLEDPWFKCIKIDPQLSDTEWQKIAWFARLFNPEIELEGN